MGHVFDHMEELSALQETHSKLLESMGPSLKQIQSTSASMIQAAKQLCCEHELWSTL